jgi:SOS-response transcriptional repressor LexA
MSGRNRRDILDPFDETIIKLVMQAKTIRGISRALGSLSSTSVVYRLKRLEDRGYILPGPRGTPKTRRVSRLGLEYLAAHGYIAREDSEAYQRLFGGG